jgi:hypothetical protein
MELTLYVILQHILFFYLLVLVAGCWQSYYRGGPRCRTLVDNTASLPPWPYFSFSRNEDERTVLLFQMASISSALPLRDLVFIVHK